MSDTPPKNTDVARALLGKLFERGKVEAGKAAKRGREMLHLRQLRLDRDRMYQKLGKEARLLMEGGELSHPGVARAVERIMEIEARIEAQESAVRRAGEVVEPDVGDAAPEGK